jgi:hypothetical protein
MERLENVEQMNKEFLTEEVGGEYRTRNKEY